MSAQNQTMNPTGAGVPAYALNGERVALQAADSQNVHGQAQPAFSTVEYIDPRKGFCSAKENTCGARRVTNSLFCAGHKRSHEAGNDVHAG
jgi:hypothetical protein